MKHLPPSISKAIEAFNGLPGVGPKTAERLVFYLLRKPDEDVRKLSDAVGGLKNVLRYCSVCSALTVEDPCGICGDETRNRSLLCVVETMLDLMALEKTGQFQGLYHVLHGAISPMEGIGPDELKIAELLSRLKEGNMKEIILALNPSLEGEATSAYLTRYLKPLNVKITRLARGIPVGGHLEYADAQTLRRALEGRMDY